MHAYQYKDTQVFTDNLQEEYLGEKSLLAGLWGFFYYYFLRGELRFGAGIWDRA